MGGFNPWRKTFWVDNMPGIQMSGRIKSKENIRYVVGKIFSKRIRKT